MKSRTNTKLFKPYDLVWGQKTRKSMSFYIVRQGRNLCETVRVIVVTVIPHHPPPHPLEEGMCRPLTARLQSLVLRRGGVHFRRLSTWPRDFSRWMMSQLWLQTKAPRAAVGINLLNGFAFWFQLATKLHVTMWSNFSILMEKKKQWNESRALSHFTNIRGTGMGCCKPLMCFPGVWGLVNIAKLSSSEIVPEGEALLH